MGFNNEPNGWVLTNLGSLVEIIMGQAPPGGACNKVGHGTIFVKAGEFSKKRPQIREWTTHPLKIAEHTDVLICVVGATAGKINLSIDCAIGRSVAALRPCNAIGQLYLFYFLSTKVLTLRGDSTGSAQGVISKEDLSKIEITLPPINEQHRIVAKIEELFSELDQSIANLKTAQSQLKVYRQSLLKHAFEGKLTAEWRAQNADKLESADALQQRIQQARTERYQQKLVEWEAKGKQGSKPKAPKPISPLTAEELDELPALPEGWGWVNLCDISDQITDGTHHTPTYLPDGVPFISVKDIRDTKVSFSDCKFISPDEHKTLSQRCKPEVNDLLITKSGTIGRLALVPDREFSLFVSVALIKTQSVKNIVLPKWYLFATEYHLLTLNIDQDIKGGLLKNYHLEDLRLAKIPLCSSIEQTSLIFKLEERISEIDQLDQTITTSLQQAEALRQSILKKAFSGELVPQNIEDEPASILLERIQAEKARQHTLISNAKSKKSKPSKDNVVPFPARLPHIEVTELHAGLMALAYRQHEQSRRAWYFGHVKAEKISHMIEACIGIDLERMPIQDAAGPNDFKRLLAVEAYARQQQWFDIAKQPNGRYFLIKLSGFDALIQRTEAALGKQLENVNALIKLFVGLDTTSSEIVATLFAAWNNLLLHGHKPSDDEIVLEARDRWHEDKLKIRKERFSRCLVWMRKHGLVPQGRGTYVTKKNQRNEPKRSI